MPSNHNATSNTLAVFVYGTLMSHFDNTIDNTLSMNEPKLGDGTFQGKMFRVNRPDGSLVYPAVVESDDPSDLVHGEIYLLSSPAIYHPLDEYEACSPDSPIPHEYERHVVDVNMANGASIKANIYLYAQPTDDLPPIPSGSFLEDIQSGIYGSE